MMKLRFETERTLGLLFKLQIFKLQSRQPRSLDFAAKAKLCCLSGLAAVGLMIVSGCEDPYAGDPPKPAEEAKTEKPRATTAYGKAMEAATDLRDKKVPEYNKKLEDLADPFNK